jgi:superfamily II DNA or RNA helicase
MVKNNKQQILKKEGTGKLYKPWQKKVIEFMTEYCVNQDGIFLYHYMGTGKTLAALGIVQNLGLQFLIVCPNSLISQWKGDYIEKYQSTLPKNVGVISYEQTDDFLKTFPKSEVLRTTLILDEAHNLVNYIEKIPMKSLQQFRKRILLSATPIYTDVSNLGFIMNIARGKNFMPIDVAAFEKKYYKVKRGKSIIVGYLAYNVLAFQNITSKISNLLYYPSIIGSGAIVVADNHGEDYFTRGFLRKILFSKSFRIFNSILTSTVHLSLTTSKYLIKGLIYILENIITNTKFLNILKVFREALFYDIIGQFTRLFSNPYTESSDIEKFFTLSMTNMISNNLFVPLIMFVICNGIVKLLLFMFRDKSELSQRENYTEPDFKKLNRDIGTYISYYKPNFKQKDQEFPTVINKKVPISLTFSQILTLLRYTVLRMNYDDYISLDIFKTYEECELKTFDQSDRNLFLKYGKFIGSSCKFTNKENTELSVCICNDILYYDTKKYSCFLKPKIVFDDIPGKYIFIEQYVTGFPNEKVVIYSESSLSVKTLSAYLNHKKIKNLLLQNECSPKNFASIFKDFYSNQTNILILDENYDEGISIKGVDTMILLEATSNVSKAEQVKARVVRLDSHPIGSKVKILDLISTMSAFPRMFGSICTWAQTSSYITYQNLYTEHNQYVTPDSISYSKLEETNKNMEKFKESIKSTSIQSLKKFPNKCEETKCKVKEIYEKSKCGEMNREIILKENENIYIPRKKKKIIK